MIGIATLCCIILAVTAISESAVAKQKIHFNRFNKHGYHREQTLSEKSIVKPRASVMQTITQRVDNFDPQNLDTYEMRYYINEEFSQVGGPLFIYAGGEWSIEPTEIDDGHFFDMAEEFNATLFYTEHRYYGESHPTVDASTANLRFLSIEQALADLAHFITAIKKNPQYENSKVVLVGKSYSATMVAWFRQLYPHLIVGAWSSSAPVLAKLDFFEYTEIVGAAIRSLGGEQCYQTFENGFRGTELAISEGQVEEIRRLFLLCDDLDFNNQLDVMNFFSSMSGILSGVVQYHSTGDLDEVCSLLLSQPGTNDVEILANWWINTIFGHIPQENICVGVDFAEDVEYLREHTWNSASTRSSSRQWFYQTCSEYGWYQTSNSPFHPFGSSYPVELDIALCQQAYDERFNRSTIETAIDRKNVLYGGFNPVVTNVYYTQGKIDPWRAMGIQTDLNESSPTDIIPDGSHRQDLESVSDSDSPEMLAVKQRIRSLIRQWLE